MSLSLMTTRYNWMGYNGTESAEDLMLRWAGSQKGLLNQKERYEVLQELEDRLFIIKIEMGLLPPEELRDIARRRAEAAREEAERLRRLQLLHEQELAAQRKALEDEEAEARMKLIQELMGTMGLSAAYERECLRAGIELIDKKFVAKTLTTAVKSYLLSQDVSFVSYLDGTSHLSLEELKSYNTSRRDRVAKEVGKLAAVPSQQSFDTSSLQLAQASMNRFRVAYDAVRAREDESFSQRLRSKERSALAANESDENETELLRRLNETQQQFEAARAEYNRNATTTATTLTLAAFRRAKEEKTTAQSTYTSAARSRKSIEEEVRDISRRSENEKRLASNKESENESQLVEA